MAKGKNRRQLWVWLDDPAFGPLQKIGTLSQGDRGSASFAYDPDWLTHAHVFPLDPELDLLPGDFYPNGSNFGVFMDSCPDRWGQLLMKRREAIEARDEKRSSRTLGPWEFLLGVQDCTRMGALRYSLPDSNIFLAAEALSAPPVTKIAELQSIAFELTRKKLASPDKIKEWLKVLVAPGASLGGARPKANLIDDQGHLWIAKFPSADDDYDVAVWEKVLHDLARDCGISVPESQLMQLGDGYHTFLVKRFDRERESRRFFASAMTLLKHVDTDDASYLELAEFLATFGEPDLLSADLEELFTRVVFNVATANRDDHLRNHGFMRSPAGWRLAPAYDMNPSFKKEEHALALDIENRLPDLSVVLATAGYYRLDRKRAKAIIEKVIEIVSDWERRARNQGLSRQDCLEAAHLFMAAGKK
ncbi:type II toxin-antitoxin system HipA family toxin [Geopsychrobacter electrodiphilus]|uniref:type II toxin-antitoxin system HipA family toxin n=1 Tax=Geopsychrobacter electrodiphilus TaxID=225196 RepID=UPI00035D1256|nr:type II toxin-antitoxin system HipA family toxin [Geopsychrobacter electrodiphilus]